MWLEMTASKCRMSMFTSPSLVCSSMRTTPTVDVTLSAVKTVIGQLILVSIRLIAKLVLFISVSRLSGASDCWHQFSGVRSYLVRQLSSSKSLVVFRTE